MQKSSGISPSDYAFDRRIAILTRMVDYVHSA